MYHLRNSEWNKHENGFRYRTIGTPQMVAFTRKKYSPKWFTFQAFFLWFITQSNGCSFRLEKRQSESLALDLVSFALTLTSYWLRGIGITKKNNFAKYPGKGSRDKLWFQRKTIIKGSIPKHFLLITPWSPFLLISRKVFVWTHETSHDLPFCFPNCELRSERKHDFPPEQWPRTVFCQRMAFRKCHTMRWSTYDDPIRSKRLLDFESLWTKSKKKHLQTNKQKFQNFI